MYCAAEIIAIKEVAERMYQHEQEKEAIRKWEMRKKAAIEYCDTVINDMLVELAENRQCLRLKIRGRLEKDSLGHRSFIPSYKKEEYDMDVLKEYLRQHCYLVAVCDVKFKISGAGTISEVELNIYPKNEN